MTREMGITRAFVREKASGRSACALLLALAGHGGLVALALEQEPARPPLVAVTEVELLEPRDLPLPEPPPELEPEPPPAAAEPRAARRAAPAKAPRPSAPQPASAAPLRTVAETTPTSEEPVRFVTDPNGTAFGYGAVQRGGTALAGVAAPMQPAAAPTRGNQEGPQPLLSRPPSLSESEPCRGFFPARATLDRGDVALKVRVETDGRVRSVAIAREQPVGQGFGFAARDCLLSKRFSPALDLAGREVAVVSPVTVRFSR